MNLKELFISNLDNVQKVLDILEIEYSNHFNSIRIQEDELNTVKFYNFLYRNDLIKHIETLNYNYNKMVIYFTYKGAKLTIDFDKKLLKECNNNSYFMDIAKRTAEQSYCNKLKVGAVLVHNNCIISTGYNGTISGFPNICEEDNKTLPEVCHAEFNAIIQCIKNNIVIPNDCILYCTHFPCFECAKLIKSINKINEIVYVNDYNINQSITLLKDIKITKWM